MTNYRFKLEKYTNPSSRHTCPNCGEKRCFSRYIDNEEKVIFPEYVGRCNREDKCGYHYPPKNYFADNPGLHIAPTFTPQREVTKPKPNFLPYHLVDESLSNYDNNNLYQFIRSKFGMTLTNEAFERYRIGTSKHWQGATVYWQIDQEGRVHTGKVMLYEPNNGKRKKQPINYINWVHSIMKIDNFHLDQCFFGEHLLSELEDLPIAIVESEKSAMIASCYIPQYLWIATGGKHGCFNKEHLKILKGRKVVLFPDLGAFELWEQRVQMMREELEIDTLVFDFLEKRASDTDKKEGYDIADYLLEKSPQRAIYEVWIENNPLLRMLVEDFDLVEE